MNKNLNSIMRHFSFFVKLRRSDVFNVSVFHLGDKLPLIDEKSKPLPYNIHERFFLNDICNAEYLNECKANCCRDIMKNVALIFSGQDYERLPFFAKKETYPILINIQRKEGTVAKLVYWGIDIKERCTFLERDGKCKIHICKPLMCQIPMIHFDVSKNEVDGEFLNITKRLYGGEFKKSCIMKLEGYKNLEELKRNKEKDLAIFERIKNEFDYLGIENRVDDIVRDICSLFEKQGKSKQSEVKKQLIPATEGELNYKAWG